MERNKRKYLSSLALIALSAVAARLYAADTAVTQGGGEIELDDVTTVISGDALTAGKESVPDYKNILPDSASGEIQLPAMDAVQETGAESGYRYDGAEKERSVYAQGEIGGGWPFSFIGDFSVYRTTGNAPFEIQFSHENAEGFGGEDASDGYFSRRTQIEAKKDFIFKGSQYSLSGAYKNGDEGFQLRSPSFTDYLWNNIDGTANAQWSLPVGWYILADASASYYNRYGTKYSAGAATENSWEDSAKYFWLEPQFSVGWSNSSFNLALFSQYTALMNMKDSGTLEKAADSSSAEAVHRGHFAFKFSWTEEDAKLWADAGIVFGTAIGSSSAIFPFTLGLKLSLSSALSSSPVTVKAEGGLGSSLASAAKIEQDSLYSVLSSLPGEQTDWHAGVSAVIPIKDMFSLSLDGQFKKTAFGNGVWQSDYKDASTILSSGYYAVQQIDRTELNTRAEFTAAFALVKLTGQWQSFWLDVPSYEDEQKLLARVVLEPESANWSASASIAQNFGEDADRTPVLIALVSAKASPSIRLAVEAQDIIKLAQRKTRDFAHSQYKQNSGHITALVRFEF